MLQTLAKLRHLRRPLARVLDPDRALQGSVTALIELCAQRHALGLGPRKWRAGQPLRLLLAGYNGTRNTGADVRVEELIRQLRHLVGPDQLELTVTTLDRSLSSSYFRGCRQVTIPQVFPKFLFSECPQHDGVVACEGSMFKSKFASALSTMMSGALGMAAVESKLSVGYGAEAGAMDRSLSRFVRRHCADSLVICRNEPSRGILGDLGVRTTGGTDTAWTFRPAPPERGRALLRAGGWDGRRKVLALCAINPFWWPVKPDLLKFASHRLSGQHAQEHYRSIYFHHRSEESDFLYEHYLTSIAEAAGVFAAERDVHVVLVGMEQLDRDANERLAERLAPKLGYRPSLYVSDEHEMYDLVSVLRQCSMLVSSRYHAIVCSMPGLVPSAGITMDERIENLLTDRGHRDLMMRVDDEDLSERLLANLQRLDRDGAAIADGIGRAIPAQLELLGEMGIAFTDELARVYPDLPLPARPRTWEHHLPALGPNLEGLLERYA